MSAPNLEMQGRVEEVRGRIAHWLGRRGRPLTLLARIAGVDYQTLWRFSTGQADFLPPEAGLRLLPHLARRDDEGDYRHVAASLALTATLELTRGELPARPDSGSAAAELIVAKAIARTALPHGIQRHLASECGIGESQLSRWLHIARYRLRPQETVRLAAVVAPRLSRPTRNLFLRALDLDQLLLLAASQTWPVLANAAPDLTIGTELLRVARLVVTEAAHEGRWRDAATFTDWTARRLAERDDPALAEAALLAAERALDVGDFESWPHWCEIALLAADRTGDRSVECRARHFKGWASLKRGSLEEARAQFERCVALAGDDREFLDDHHWLGNVHLAQAQANPYRAAELLNMAETHYAQARDFHERRGAEFNAAYDALNFAVLERLRGRHDLSRRLRRRAEGVFDRDAARLQVELQDMEDEVAGAGPARVARWAQPALAQLSAIGFAEAVAGVLRVLSVAHWSAGTDDVSRARARVLIVAAEAHYPTPPWELDDLPKGLTHTVNDPTLQRQVIEMIGAGEDVFKHVAPLRVPPRWPPL